MPPCPRGLCPQAPPRGFSRALAFLGSASPGAGSTGLVRLSSYRGTPWTRRHRFSSRPSLPSPSTPRALQHPPGRAPSEAAWPDPWPSRCWPGAPCFTLSLSRHCSIKSKAVWQAFFLVEKGTFFFFIFFIAIFQSPKWGERKVFQEFSRRALLSASLFLERRYFIKHAHENGTSLKEHKTEASRQTPACATEDVVGGGGGAVVNGAHVFCHR